MQLSVIQYDAIMMVIDQAYDAIENNTLLDPYADNPNNYSNESILTALQQVERKIMSDNLPL